MSDFETEGGGLMKIFGVTAAGVTVPLVLSPGGSIDSAGGGAGLVPNGTNNDQRLTVDDTAGGVAFAAFPANTTHVLITSEAAEIRYTLDTSAPTTTNGHVLAKDQERVWNVTMAAAMKAIRTTATSGVLHASPLKAA